MNERNKMEWPSTHMPDCAILRVAFFSHFLRPVNSFGIQSPYDEGNSISNATALDFLALDLRSYLEKRRQKFILFSNLNLCLNFSLCIFCLNQNRRLEIMPMH